MDKQIKTQNIQITEFQKQISDLNCEINRLNDIIKNLTLDLANNKKEKIQVNNMNRNTIIAEILKIYTNKLLSIDKMKFLLRLILKMKYEQMKEKNKIIVETKTTPITPPPNNRIKIVKRNPVEGNPDVPGKVSYKRRNENKDKK